MAPEGLGPSGAGCAAKAADAEFCKVIPEIIDAWIDSIWNNPA
jgi:hypothetical protein